MKVKVSNYWDVPNQFVIWTDEGSYFQSYESIIVFRPNDGSPTQLGSDWEYSRTTGKYRNKFLNETKAETQAKLDAGIYVLNEQLAVGDKLKYIKLPTPATHTKEEAAQSIEDLLLELEALSGNLGKLWEG